MSDSAIASTAADKAPAAPRSGWPSALRTRLKPALLALTFPAAILIFWHVATAGRQGSLIPPPSDVWLELKDLAVGGVNDDAYSGTLWVHLAASVSRVFGGFANGSCPGYRIYVQKNLGKHRSTPMPRPRALIPARYPCCSSLR